MRYAQFLTEAAKADSLNCCITENACAGIAAEVARWQIKHSRGIFVSLTSNSSSTRCHGWPMSINSGAEQPRFQSCRWVVQELGLISLLLPSRAYAVGVQHIFYVQSLLQLLMNLPHREFESSFLVPCLHFVSSYRPLFLRPRESTFSTIAPNSTDFSIKFFNSDLMGEMRHNDSPSAHVNAHLDKDVA